MTVGRVSIRITRIGRVGIRSVGRIGRVGTISGVTISTIQKSGIRLIIILRLSLSIRRPLSKMTVGRVSIRIAIVSSIGRVGIRSGTIGRCRRISISISTIQKCRISISLRLSLCVDCSKQESLNKIDI
jgi:hypothetical protein